jgi:uncharacterized membrane protein (GlpM family)
MNIQSIIIAFLVGGTVTTLITALEVSNMRVWSGIAALAPVFTLISYLFIAKTESGLAVSQHAKFLLVGTIITWTPYMLTIILLAPRIGSVHSVVIGFLIFCVFAAVFVFITQKLSLFR